MSLLAAWLVESVGPHPLPAGKQPLSRNPRSAGATRSEAHHQQGMSLRLQWARLLANGAGVQGFGYFLDCVLIIILLSLICPATGS